MLVFDNRNQAEKAATRFHPSYVRRVASAKIEQYVAVYYKSMRLQLMLWYRTSMDV